MLTLLGWVFVEWKISIGPLGAFVCVAGVRSINFLYVSCGVLSIAVGFTFFVVL